MRLRAPSQQALSDHAPSVLAAAGSGLLGESQLSPRTECACAPSQQALSDHASSEQAAAGSGLLGESQLSLRTECAYARPLRPSPLRPCPLRSSAPQALDCWENHSSLRARSAPARPPNTPSPTMPGTAGLRLPDHRSEPKWHGHPACDPKPEWPLR